MLLVNEVCVCPHIFQLHQRWIEQVTQEHRHDVEGRGSILEADSLGDVPKIVDRDVDLRVQPQEHGVKPMIDPVQGIGPVYLPHIRDGAGDVLGFCIRGSPIISDAPRDASINACDV
jgi:hypothetical protein